jgi:uncharacterized membrane protein
MKILGHPVHIMLIHFPSALFPMDLLGSWLGLRLGDPAFTKAAFFAAVAGVIIGWMAVVFGALDLLRINSEHPTSLKKALLHGGINIIVLGGFTLLVYRSWKMYPALTTDSIMLLIIKGLLVALMIIGNFIGGSLILKDKIAVENK